MTLGIDYGMGTTNIDRKTGIRYGVIPANDVGQSWFEDAESDYGEPTCPKCGNAVKDTMATEESELNSNGDEIEYEQYGHGCADFACDTCKHTLDSQDCFGDTPIAFTYSSGGYEMRQGGDDTDIFVMDSPYYTFAPFCSPCAPGACYLPSAHDGGTKAYCLGHEWFEGETAPYPVYSVATGQLVAPTAA